METRMGKARTKERMRYWAETWIWRRARGEVDGAGLRKGLVSERVKGSKARNLVDQEMKGRAKSVE